jgi:hypothetical protein
MDKTIDQQVTVLAEWSDAKIIAEDAAQAAEDAEQAAEDAEQATVEAVVRKVEDVEADISHSNPPRNGIVDTIMNDSVQSEYVPKNVRLTRPDI